MSHAHDNSATSPIARAFVEARRGGRALEGYPGPQPESLAAAYAIQDEAISAWPDRVAGWKLGRINTPHDVRFGAGRLAGVLVIVGGAPVNEKFARDIGADGYAQDGGEAVDLARRLLAAQS